MTDVTRHPHGAFSWADLATPDPDGAKRFYGELFDLSFVDETMGPEGTYTRLQRGGRDVAGLYRMLPQQRGHGVSAYWLPYVTVDSADAGAERAAALGGRVLLPPLDAHDAGRMAVVVDPCGAHLGLWEARRKIGAEVMHAPGTLTWAELQSTDVAAAVPFLTALLGWEARPVDTGAMIYTLLATAHGPIAGAMQVRPEWGPVPSHWVVYFAVADCDAAVERVRQLGGVVHVPPVELADVGRFTVCSDPQGAIFEVLQPARRA
jgi:predicted enzyme related to lactoylglutathione lyase